MGQLLLLVVLQDVKVVPVILLLIEVWSVFINIQVDHGRNLEVILTVTQMINWDIQLI